MTAPHASDPEVLRLLAAIRSGALSPQEATDALDRRSVLLAPHCSRIDAAREARDCPTVTCGCVRCFDAAGQPVAFEEWKAAPPGRSRRETGPDARRPRPRA